MPGLEAADGREADGRAQMRFWTSLSRSARDSCSFVGPILSLNGWRCRGC